MSGQPDKLPVVAAWSRVLVVLGARTYRSLLLALVVIAVAPLAVGWGAYVVKSGSMEPSIAVGDVTLARPLEAGDKVRVGRVFVFDDPSSRTERTLVHRIVELRDDGDYTTAGDANNLTDVTPLPRGAVDSQAVLLVPWVGLPVVWMQTDQWLKLLLALLFTIAAFVVATRNLDGEPPKWTMLRVVRDPGDRQSQRRRPRRRASGVGRSVIPAVAATTALIFVGASATTAGAAFTDRTLNGASNWRAGQGHQPYVAAVLADSPFGFWLLDEPGGTWADDRSVHDRTGRYYDPASYQRPGGLPNNPGSAIATDGGRVILGPDQVTSPSSYSIELWFRTTSRSMGYLAGFESSTFSLSGRADRTLLMEDGRLVFGSWPSWITRSITSPKAYNDGRWHHVVLTSTNQQSTLYVDGAQVTAGSTTAVDSYFGYWRIGSGSIGFFSGLIGSFNGELDNVAIYTTALSAQRVAAHWAAR